MQFDPNKAIYLQIADHIMNRIMDGTFSTDQRVPSVRELAAEMEVNPNTTVRSYEWLEQRGIIFNRRGCGYFVAANGHEIVSGMRRAEFYADELPRFFERIRALGWTPMELASEYENFLKQ
ncbi:GntR family transcriptional regulator [Paramuribaculum intestinale]|uniref:GntR family transcriptional regulator n=1 Tax=Paramuribaculum intestinale TaxID=2094151 RepID=UPI0025A56CDF|nr:GntR family transcriptional regulator [Paramuribaculum intestinale]